MGDKLLLNFGAKFQRQFVISLVKLQQFVISLVKVQNCHHNVRR